MKIIARQRDWMVVSGIIRESGERIAMEACQRSSFRIVMKTMLVLTMIVPAMMSFLIFKITDSLPDKLSNEPSPRASSTTVEAGTKG